MKRPKLADMAPLELARWRALQSRRSAQRALKQLSFIRPGDISPQQRETLKATEAYARSIIATTKPSWVRPAGLHDLHSMLGYHSALTGERRHLN
jgi:hypothetical protein